ncbi:MAG: carbon-nitrogen hydrolase family protein [bacterium]|nr:carbon-nitrogen hydrolase family protein [bacterium]
MTMKTPNLYAEPWPSLKLGLCQVYTEPWATDDNLKRTLESLETAAGEGAELAITPECVLHGYADTASPDYAPRLLAAAERLDGPRIQALCRAARDLSLDLVVGFAERGAGDQVHNSAAFIGRTGAILSVYRKVHCRPFESIHHQGRFVPGETFTVETLIRGERVFRVGTMICFDREVPESVRCLRGLGAELIACPLATNTSRLDALGEQADNEMLTRVRAAENEVFIAVINHAGRYNGGSFVVGPGGQTLCQLGAESEVRVIDLPLGIVPARFHADPWGWMGWGYRRPEIYAKYI